MREMTNKLIELAEEGILRWEDIALECLDYMSEDDVKAMADGLDPDLFDDDEEEDE